MAENAPVILFVYKRPSHTQMTIDALKSNHLADQTDLLIYSDGAKGSEDADRVNQVRGLIKSVKGFRTIQIIESPINKGLSNSIISGVSDVIEDYGKVIVLEDDMISSPYFLSYMNHSLKHYENILKVWHINGWIYPVSNSLTKDTYLWRVMNCWGWGTWKNRWRSFEKDPNELISSFTPSDILKFSLRNRADFWDQVIGNFKGYMNTWAIFWYASIFKNQGLCLSPGKSLIENIGLDGSGTHCKEQSSSNKEMGMEDYLPDHRVSEIEESSQLVKTIESYLMEQKSIRGKLLTHIKNVKIRLNL